MVKERSKQRKLLIETLLLMINPLYYFLLQIRGENLGHFLDLVQAVRNYLLQRFFLFILQLLEFTWIS